MRWMVRFFEEVIAGKPRRLVDLETGAGKTELVVIWLLALAWSGTQGRSGSAVPRRLVWVVNRRVLVQQVFGLAGELRRKLTNTGLSELDDVRTGLRVLEGADGHLFQLVELRGQIVADRDWAIRPTTPQLIIGTVDQIGSRVLFQGYGLGKWGRPQQAGMLGVDAWVAIDEAHLVPAFVLTLRQLRERCAAPAANLTPPFDALFARLPFWLTELSATPGLPRPSQEKPFRLRDEERTDHVIKDRVLAASTRRVLLEWLPKAEKATEKKEALVQRLVAAATTFTSGRIAVFVREVGVADAVTKGIAAQLKKKGIAEERICKITGRIRGYERDQLSKQTAFRAFLVERQEPIAGANAELHFLVGTAAAEVGLDADADVILCDFAPLPTLLQRLGRLDRRGVLSRRFEDNMGEQPAMRIFTPQEETKRTVKSQLSSLATALNAETTPWSAELMSGANWALKEKKKDTDEEEKSAKDQTRLLIEAATWTVLHPTGAECTSPRDWLTHEYARIAAGPVLVPPVTDPVLDYFSATTEARSPQISPHPFLYGLADNDEGTPLVGIAFRLEVEALRESAEENDDTETPDAVSDVIEIFKRFPPLRAELHHVKLSVVREWLASSEAAEHPLVYRKQDKWLAKVAGESGSTVAASLAPVEVLILPASILMLEPCKRLLEDCEQPGGKEGQTNIISDVLDGVSDPQRAHYLRSIVPSVGLSGGQGALLWEPNEREEKPSTSAKPEGFNQALRKELRIGGSLRVFRYYRRSRNNDQLQYLDPHDGALGHLARAVSEANRLAQTMAPGNVFLSSLLSAAALAHDEGKRFPKWQRAFGWRSGMPPLAKLHPDSKKPAPLGGFRHEWESLRQLKRDLPAPPEGLSPEAQALWRDLLLHLVGVHHGHLRPSIVDDGLTPDTEAEKQNPLRLEALERFGRLQSQLGHWRLAHLEGLLKTADAEGSRDITEDENDGN